MDSEKSFLKNLYREGKLSFEKDYFKSLLNLSAGALALSITIAQVAFDSKIILSQLLVASWILLGIAVILVLLYFVLGQYEFEKRIEDIELKNNISLRNKKELDELTEHTGEKLYGSKIKAHWILNEENIKRKFYDKLGLLSSTAFFIGIILLGIFTYFNLLIQ